GKPVRLVQDVRGRDAGGTIDLLLHRGAIGQQVERLTYGRVAQERVCGLDAGALAVHVLARVGEVALDVLDVAARHDVGVTLTALLHALENVVLDLHVPRVVELAGLDDGARGR